MTATITEWPKNQIDQLQSFYGKLQLGPDGRPTQGWETSFLNQISTPYRLKLAWNQTITINKLTCHREVTPSLHRILGEILTYFETPEAVSEAKYDVFAGCYEFRSACASHKLSMHAYGAAILLGPLHSPRYQPNEHDKAVAGIFEAEGWAWLGAAEGYGAIRL